MLIGQNIFQDKLGKVRKAPQIIQQTNNIQQNVFYRKIKVAERVKFLNFTMMKLKNLCRFFYEILSEKINEYMLQ